MKPLIFLSYGMTKSGSTLGFELARTALEFCGYSQPILSRELVTQEKAKINYIHRIHVEKKQLLLDEVRAIGHPIAIKTHGRPTPAVKELIQEGYAIGHAIYRDPRDIALSLLDHGARARKAGEKAFSGMVVLDDALKDIRHQVETLRLWLTLPNIQPLYFDDIAFDTENCCVQIMQQLGINQILKKNNIFIEIMTKLGLRQSSPQSDDLPQKVVEHVLNKRFTQFNKGVPNRYKTEMSPEDSKRIEEEFAPFFAKLIYTNPSISASEIPFLSPKDILRINN